LIKMYREWYAFIVQINKYLDNFNAHL